MDHLFHDWLRAIAAFLLGLLPAALGAAVSLAYETGLSWADRFIRLAVGVIVSYFVAGAVGAVVTLDAFVLQAIGFTVGMIAYKATPAFTRSAVEAVAGLPGAIRDRVLPRKGDQ